ncbi:hypothetical protein GCM10023238_02050 [Streptomyces heliomycini]
MGTDGSDRLALPAPLRLGGPASHGCSGTRTTGTGASPRPVRTGAPAAPIARTTLVLDTEWETPEGAVLVTDLMPQRHRAPDLVADRAGRPG